MTESPTPSKFAKWKRTLIGGLFSAGFAGTFIWASYLQQPKSEIYDFLLFCFSIPSMLFSSSPRELFYHTGDYARPDFLYLTTSVLLWFIFGSFLANKIKGNYKAVGCWILLLFLMYPIFFVLLFLVFGSM